MKRTYLKELSVFALEKTLHRTDTASLFIGILIPAVLTVAHKTVADVGILVAWLVIGAVLSISAVRLATAPYFLWKKQNEKIALLQEQNAKPDQKAREAMSASLIEDRKRLAATVIDLKAEAWIAESPQDVAIKISGHRLLSGLFTVDEEFDRLWGLFLRAATNYSKMQPKVMTGETEQSLLSRRSQYMNDNYQPLEAATKAVVDWLLYRG